MPLSTCTIEYTLYFTAECIQGPVVERQTLYLRFLLTMSLPPFQSTNRFASSRLDVEQYLTVDLYMEIYKNFNA